MKILNCTTGNIPVIPTELSEKVFIFITCKLTEKFCKLYHQALKIVLAELQEDNMKISELQRVTVIFSAKGDVALQPESHTTKVSYGQQTSIIIYVVDELVVTNHLPFQLFVFVEELVHHFWTSDNETYVKLKTIKILKRILPHLTIQEVQSWELNWN